MSDPSFEQMRALLIEDDDHTRLLLRSVLQTLKIRDVIECADGESAFATLQEKENNVDFVLTDLSMTPIDGIEFTKMVRTSKESPNPYVPIIMVTGHTERPRVEAARDAGVTEFLAKPITVQALRLRISEIVERPRSFVRSNAFFGPDRRRKRDTDFTGPWRRKDDTDEDVDFR